MGKGCGWVGIVILSICEYYFFRLPENLVQHPSNIKSIFRIYHFAVYNSDSFDLRMLMLYMIFKYDYKPVIIIFLGTTIAQCVILTVGILECGHIG